MRLPSRLVWLYYEAMTAVWIYGLGAALLVLLIRFLVG
jgi:hypothetical protein